MKWRKCVRGTLDRARVVVWSSEKLLWNKADSFLWSSQERTRNSKLYELTFVVVVVALMNGLKFKRVSFKVCEKLKDGEGKCVWRGCWNIGNWVSAKAHLESSVCDSTTFCGSCLDPCSHGYRSNTISLALFKGVSEILSSVIGWPRTACRLIQMQKSKAAQSHLKTL